MQNDEEIWKDVASYEGLYMVSNKGRVKSLPREKINGEYVLSLPLNKNGHPVVRLCKSGKPTTMLVHRLVAKAFIPNPNNKPKVRYKDGNKSNACVENLEWCTTAESSFYAGGESGGGKKIIQKDFSGNKIKVWGNVKEAFFGTGILHISKAAKQNISAGGFLWSYEEKSVSEKKKDEPPESIVQKDLDGNVIMIWESIHEIKKENSNYKMKLILDVCRGGMRSAYDFIWEFEKPAIPEETQEQGGFSIIENSETTIK